MCLSSICSYQIGWSIVVTKKKFELQVCVLTKKFLFLQAKSINKNIQTETIVNTGTFYVSLLAC